MPASIDHVYRVLARPFIKVAEKLVSLVAHSEDMSHLHFLGVRGEQLIDEMVLSGFSEGRYNTMMSNIMTRLALPLAFFAFCERTHCEKEMTLLTQLQSFPLSMVFRMRLVIS